MASITGTKTYYFDPAKHEIHDTPADDRVRVKLSSPKTMEPSDQEKIIQLAGYQIQTFAIKNELDPYSNQTDKDIYNACFKISRFLGDFGIFFANKYPGFMSEAVEFKIHDKQNCYALFEKIQNNLTKYFGYKSGISEEKLQDFKESNPLEGGMRCSLL